MFWVHCWRRIKLRGCAAVNLQFLLLLVLGIFIAYVNGANDVSKGIATLAGSGVTRYQRAIIWGSFWSAIGGLGGALLAGGMIQTFGKGLLADGTAPTLTAALATIIGLGTQDRGRLHWNKISEMLLAWVINLPATAALGIAVFVLLHLLATA